MSAFARQLAEVDLPPPGPELFQVRRALWRTPMSNPPTPTEPNASRLRLENLLALPDALESDDTWAAGLDRVWHGLIGGARLRHRLPLALVIKILQAGWIHEGTWPKGAVAPDSDEELDKPTVTPQEQSSLLSMTTAANTPTVTTPGSLYATDTPERAELDGEVDGEHSQR
ncbi:hypothetical protein BV20DRAFT_948875 [Pilatotrama ljubarskyi]|nr:hypothetical protein BV20DRAFT_948875 [Pilatotrama ljubarskyi]